MCRRHESASRCSQPSSAFRFLAKRENSDSRYMRQFNTQKCNSGPSLSRVRERERYLLSKCHLILAVEDQALITINCSHSSSHTGISGDTFFGSRLIAPGLPSSQAQSWANLFDELEINYVTSSWRADHHRGSRKSSRANDDAQSVDSRAIS
jgi:hypothetical protein